MKKMTKKWKWGLLFALSATLIGGSITSTTLAAKKEKASSRASTEIKLDEGTDKEFVVPADATQLVEPDLMTDSKFNGYVQNTTSVMNLYKQKLNAFSSFQEDVIKPATITYTEDNKILAVVQSRNDNDFILGLVPNRRYTETIVLMDSDGTPLDQKNIATWKPTNMTATSFTTENDYAEASSPFTYLGNNKYQMTYGGFTPTDTTLIENHILKFEIKNNELTDFSVEKDSLSDDDGTLLSIKENLLGDSSGDIYKYGITWRAAPYSPDKRVHPIYKNQKKLVDLKYPYDNPEISWDKYWGDWLYELGRDSTNNGFYGRVLERNDTNSKILFFLCFWDDQGNLIHKEKVNSGNSNDVSLFKILPASNSQVIYTQEKTDQGVEIYEYTLEDNKSQIISKRKKIFTFSEGSSLNLSEDKFNGYTLYGQSGSDDGPLKNKGIKKDDFFIALLDTNKNIISAQSLKLTGTFNPETIIDMDNNQLFIGGTGTTRDFSDKPFTGDWSSYPGLPDLESTNNNAIFGILKRSVDYSPAIKLDSKPFVVNIDEPFNEQALLDRLDVFDTYSLSANNISGQKTEEWLKQRINRNPNKIEYESDGLTVKSLPDIEWDKLGYDKNVVGPHSVTYFATDDQRQATATSGIIVNNYTDSTIIKRQSFIDTHNFSVKLSDVKSGALDTNQKIKKKAKTVAWEADGRVIEDYQQNLYNDDKVIFKNNNQVEAIRNATSAKPYPLDIVYKGDSTVEKRIWVFVTDDNTVVENGVILYANDFKIPLKEVGSLTADDILKKKKFKNTEPKVIAYDYLTNESKENTLTPLSVGKTDGTSKGLSIDPNNLTQINSASSATVLTNVGFTYTNPKDSKVTTVKVNVTIEDTSEFCFKLERTKESISFVDLTLDDTIDGTFKSMEVIVPKHVVIDHVPSGWTRLPDNEDTTKSIYRFNMKNKNSKADIKTFLEALTLKMDVASNATNTDKPGTVEVKLHEEELLSDAKSRSIIKERVLSSSSVISEGDFGLNVRNVWDPSSNVNYVDLDWDEVTNLSNSGYTLYQSEDSGTSWNARSTNYNKAINVLNIYPDLPTSNTLKTWMDGLGLVDKDGNNLINVTPVSISDYNANPDNYLKDSSGNYQYDVLMLGSWDRYNDLDINDISYEATRKFIDSGRGVLFGHDTAYYSHPYFMKFTDMIGLADDPNGTSYLDKVEVVDDGYMMKYPFSMENGQILTIPPTHSVMSLNENIAKRWMRFSDVADGDKLSNPNWYLATNGNVGMIQTGHSNGQSTDDERKIIANTLYNLAQVSLDNKAQDYTVKDKANPTVVDSSITRNHDNTINVEAVDAGTQYQYYVAADTKDKGILKSDVVQTEIISDIKGYVYVVDENPTTVPTVDKDAYGNVTNLTATVTDPDMDRSVTIGGISKEGQYIHIIPVDRSNNVGEVKHIKVGDVPFADEPAVTGCTHDIPQKVYIKGKDTFGRVLTAGDQVIDTNLRLNKEYTFTPTTITNYQFMQLQSTDNTKIDPMKFTIKAEKQEAEVIYRRKTAKVHIRQEVLNTNKTVVVPKQGHADLVGKTLDGSKNSKLTVPFNSSDKSTQAYTDYEIEIDEDKAILTVDDIVPMYYKNKGYVVTTSNTEHKSANAVASFTPINLSDYPEIWVTIYVEPTAIEASFYGWMYGQDGTYQVNKKPE